jgi:hypothetical protein
MRRTDLRVRAVIGLGVLLLAAAGLSTGCATRSAGAATSAQLASTQQMLDQLTVRIEGDLEDRRATELLIYVAYQRPIRDCMAKAGFSYTPPGFENPSAHWPSVRPLSEYDELVPTDAEHVTSRGLYVAEDLANIPAATRTNPGYTTLDAAGKAAYDRQVDQCQPQASTYQDIGRPALSATLFGALDLLIGSVVQTPQVKALSAGYAGCMAGKGLAAANREELTSSVRKAFEALVDVGSGRLATASPQFAAAKAEEQRAAQADADCRRTAHELLLGLLQPKLVQFESDHATELEQLAADWADVRATAAAVEKTIDW